MSGDFVLPPPLVEEDGPSLSELLGEGPAPTAEVSEPSLDDLQAALDGKTVQTDDDLVVELFKRAALTRLVRVDARRRNRDDRMATWGLEVMAKDSTMDGPVPGVIVNTDVDMLHVEREDGVPGCGEDASYLFYYHDVLAESLVEPFLGEHHEALTEALAGRRVSFAADRLDHSTGYGICGSDRCDVGEDGAVLTGVITRIDHDNSVVVKRDDIDVGWYVNPIRLIAVDVPAITASRAQDTAWSPKEGDHVKAKVNGRGDAWVEGVVVAVASTLMNVRPEGQDSSSLVNCHIEGAVPLGSSPPTEQPGTYAEAMEALAERAKELGLTNMGHFLANWKYGVADMLDPHSIEEGDALPPCSCSDCVRAAVEAEDCPYDLGQREA
jgi:hypothetical protein